LSAAGLPALRLGDGSSDTAPEERTTTMSEPGSTEAAGEGLSDQEMAETVAGQTDSASENADEAGKDWNGDPSQAHRPD
jgi:hypothetical protein